MTPLVNEFKWKSGSPERNCVTALLHEKRGTPSGRQQRADRLGGDSTLSRRLSKNAKAPLSLCKRDDSIPKTKAKLVAEMLHNITKMLQC